MQKNKIKRKKKVESEFNYMSNEIEINQFKIK